MSDKPTTADAPSTNELTALAAIAEGTAHVTGQEFFRSLARHLAAAVGTRYAFVAEFAGARGCGRWRTGIRTDSRMTSGT